MKNLLFLALTFLFSYTYAQTGPAGVGSSPDNPLWLDATDLGLSNNDPVGTWTDKSGNGNNFSQGTSNKQPRWLNYTSPMVRFDGGDYLHNAGMAGMNSATQTQFIVLQSTAANHNGEMYSSAYAEHNTLLRTFRTNGGLMRSQVKNSTPASINVDDTHSTNEQIWTSTWDGLGAQEIAAYRNGLSLGSAGGAGNTATGNFKNRIGSATNSGNKYNGDIFEIINYLANPKQPPLILPSSIKNSCLSMPML